MQGKVMFLQGNEATVEGALYAGLKFYAGYPITPSSEVAEILSERLPQIGGKFIQMEDEIASMCAIIGASLTGLKVMTATSGPGFSLMQEAIGYAVMAEIPSVVVNVQRGGPSTGLPTAVAQGDVLQARWGTHGDHSIITLTASKLQDVFTMTIEAFNLAETFRTPVILLLDEVVAHMRGLIHDMWGFPSNDPKVAYDLLHHLMDKVENRADSMARYREYFTEDADVLLISYGSSARSAQHLVEMRRERGAKLGLLELQSLWPFPRETVRERCEGRSHVLVVEMNMGQICQEVRKAVSDPEKVFLANRFDGVLISHDDILKVLNMIQGKGV